MATIPIERDWVRDILAVDGWVLVRSLVDEESTLTAGTLTVIDPEGNDVVTSKAVGPQYAPLVEWDGLLWAGARRNLVRINPSTADSLGDALAMGKGVSHTSLATGEGGVWFLGYEPDDESVPATVDRFNPLSGRVDVSVDPRENPTAMATGQESIWLLNYEGSLTRIDVG